MRDESAIPHDVPIFLRRPEDRAPAKPAIKRPDKTRARLPRAPLPDPRSVIHGGTAPVVPGFAKAQSTPSAPPGQLASQGEPDSAVVDLTAHRSAGAEPRPVRMYQDLRAAFGGDQDEFGEDDDAAFQVTLPRSVIRQIRVAAAEEGTTHRAIVLRALRAAGLDIPEGADVDRRVLAAKRRQQA